MKTITTQQSESKYSERAAMNDDRLIHSDVLLLICINRVLFSEPFILTGEEIESRWSILRKNTTNRSINKLVECGYVKREYKNTLFARSRSLTTVDNPIVKKVDHTERDALFVKFWNAYKYKKGNEGAKKSWAKLTPKEWAKAIDTAPLYLASLGTTSQKFAQGWLTDKRFNDEYNKPKPQGYQSVTKAYDKTQTQKEEDRAYNLKMDRLDAERKARREARTLEYGWERPFVEYKDKMDNDIRVKSGGEDNVEKSLTLRLKREGKKYTK